MPQPLEDAALDWKLAQDGYYQARTKLVSLLRAGHSRKDDSLLELIRLIGSARRSAQKTLETSLLFLSLGGGFQINDKDGIKVPHATASDIQQTVAGWVQEIEEFARAVKARVGTDEIDDIVMKQAPQIFPGGSVQSHEDGPNSGHTITKHIADWMETAATLDWNINQLEAYLVSNPDECRISTFFRLNAEQAIGSALEANGRAIKDWIAQTDRKTKHEYYYDYGSVVGLYKEPGKAVVSCKRLVVVLLRLPNTQLGFKIKTAYPLQ